MPRLEEEAQEKEPQEFQLSSLSIRSPRCFLFVLAFARCPWHRCGRKSTRRGSQGPRKVHSSRINRADGKKLPALTGVLEKVALSCSFSDSTLNRASATQPGATSRTISCGMNIVVLLPCRQPKLPSSDCQATRTTYMPAKLRTAPALQAPAPASAEHSDA